MLTGRNSWLVGSWLLVSIGGCENRDPLAPITARQTRDPSDLYAKPLTSSTVQVTWTDSSPNEITFRIERSATGTGPWVMAGTTNRNVTTLDDEGSASEQQVCYRVFAVFRNGLSNPSNTSCTTAPAAPTKLTATPVDHQTIDVAWMDNSAVEDGYYVERATAQAGPYEVVAFLAANTVTYRQSGLTTNTPYWYRARATNDGGYGDYSNIASATPTFTVPRAPSATDARPISGSVLVIRWVDNASNETGFRLERSRDGGANWETSWALSQNALVFYDGVGIQEQQFCYRVFAFNAQGDSPPSDADCTALPAGPTNLVAEVIAGVIELMWTDNSAVEDGYDVWRSGGGSPGYVRLASLAANTIHYTDAGVSPDQLYTYFVEAMKDGGPSTGSNEVAAVVATTPPAAPTSVNAIPGWSSTAAWISWISNSTNEAGFRVERSIDGGTSWVAAGTVLASGGESFYDGGLASEQKVCYRVIAFNSEGDSPASGTACTIPPAAATNLTAVQTDAGVELHWTDNSAFEDSYEIVLWTVCSEQPDYWIASVPANSTSALIGDMSPWLWCGDFPWAYVVVTNDGGYGDFSNGVYTGASSSATSTAPPVPAAIRRARVKP